LKEIRRGRTGASLEKEIKKRKTIRKKKRKSYKKKKRGQSKLIEKNLKGQRLLERKKPVLAKGGGGAHKKKGSCWRSKLAGGNDISEPKGKVREGKKKDLRNDSEFSERFGGWNIKKVSERGRKSIIKNTQSGEKNQ